ncbi:MAG: DUF1150 family protein [Paracoccaceae bacterium]|jgi:hypothetical protein
MSESQPNPNSSNKIVYIREVAAKDLPKDVQSQIGKLKKLYAVHSDQGERLALVKERNLAFVLARQNDLSPVTVH